MTRDECLEGATRRVEKRRKLRLILTSLNLPALSLVLGQLGDEELSDLEKLIDKPPYKACERAETCPNFTAK